MNLFTHERTNEPPGLCRPAHWRRAAALLLVGAALAAAPPAAAQNPFNIDGVVIPDAGSDQFDDPHGGDMELGPENGNHTKFAVIHAADPPMLGDTNPNGKVDLIHSWIQYAVDANGDVWLYAAWEREGTTGSGFVMFEFQTNAQPLACDYAGASEADLIAGCNPFANRQDGDFVLVWDEQGNSIDLFYRVFDSGGGTDPEFGPEIGIPSAVGAVAIHPDQHQGEAAVNLTQTVFANQPSECVNISNVIPGTVTGNSDTADYKDVILFQGALFASCFLDVEKDAATGYTRTHEWEIFKSATPDVHDLFSGQTADSDYTVTVNKTGFDDSDFAVSGTITITNDNPEAATITSVVDEISGGVVAPVDCGVAFPHVLAANGGVLECTYAADLGDASNRTNTVTVTTSGDVFGGTDEADVVFGDPTTVVNDEVTVTDAFDGGAPEVLGVLSASDVFEYSRTFQCGESDVYPNTATIVETGQTADADVTVNCHGLTVAKECTTSFTRDFEWAVAKSATNVDGPLMLAVGQPFAVHYDVTATKVGHSDRGWAASCDITVANDHPTEPAVVLVADALPDATNGALTCDGQPGDLLNVPAGGSASCTYTADLPDATARANTATATHDGVVYTSPEADVIFGDPTTVLDDCALVSDEALGFGPEKVCATTTFNETDGLFYDIDTAVCHDESRPFDNVGKAVEEDSDVEHSDDEGVSWNIPCPQASCTLTPGYWKTHSMAHNDGKHYDDTWALLDPDDGDDLTDENDTFFLSDASYIDVLWTSPKGNAYFNLSFHYIAAELNALNGAGMPTTEPTPISVQAAFGLATELFETYTPAEVAVLKGKNGKELRSQFITLAGILAGFNEGTYGTGHCSDDGTTSETGADAVAAGTSAASDSPASAEDAVATEDGPALATTAAVVPTEFSLSAAYPNPSRGVTRIEFALPEAATVSLVVYDLLGRQVDEVLNGSFPAGTHRAVWNARSASEGTYLLLFRTDDVVRSQRVTVVR